MILFIFLLFVLISCQKIGAPSEEYNKFFGAITLNPNSYFSNGGYLNEGDTIDFGFYATETNIQKFFIADEDNFNKWKNNENAQFIVSYDNLREIDLKQPIVKSGKYYAVILNSSTKQKVFIRTKKI
ncbi:MAG: hypothetical protein ABIL76_08540 [candidate division WOR-3 bacterium]